VQLDPVGDFFTRSVIKAGDLTAVYAVRDARDNLRVCAQVVEETIPEITYAIHLKALTDNGSGILSLQATSGHASAGSLAVQRSGVYACSSVSLAQLGNPWAVYVGANTMSGGRVIDETGWQMINVTH
jgi:hypothetical protein